MDQRAPRYAEELTETVLKGYDPNHEALEKYVDRIVRQARALGALGQPLVDGVLEWLVAKATIKKRIFDETGGTPERILRHLERDLALEYVAADGSSEQTSKIEALVSLLV